MFLEKETCMAKVAKTRKNITCMAKRSKTRETKTCVRHVIKVKMKNVED